MSLSLVDFHSKVLGFDSQIYVVMPEEKQGVGFATIRARNDYPVLYLLHGTSGDHTDWIRWTSAERYAAKRGIAIVTPAAQLSSYANMAHGERFFDYISYEVPEVVKEIFPMLDQ